MSRYPTLSGKPRQAHGGTGAAFADKGRDFDLDQPCPTILGTKPNQLEVDMQGYAVGREPLKRIQP